MNNTDCHEDDSETVSEVDDEEDEEEAQFSPSELVSLMNDSYAASCAKDFLSESDLEDKVLGLGYSFTEDVMKSE